MNDEWRPGVRDELAELRATVDALKAEVGELRERHGWDLDRMRSLEVRIEELERRQSASHPDV